MKKIYLLLTLCCLSIAAGAQTAASYSFSRASGTFSSIVGGSGTVSTSVISSDDLTLTDIPIGFTFRYCGTNYTTLSAQSNGYVSLANNSTQYYPTYVNSTSSFSSIGGGVGMLLPFWGDLYGNYGTAYYQTTGSAGSRVFTFQWTNWNPWGSSTYAMNFQVKLYESSGVIQFVYGTYAAAPGAAQTIGICNSSTDYLTLSSESATSASTTFYSGCNIPANGSVMTWTPPASVTPVPTALTFTTGVSTTSSAQTTTITGLGFTSSPITVTAPSNFQVYNGSSWVSSYTIATTSAGVGTYIPSTAVQVRFVGPSTVGTYTGNLTFTGGGLSSAVNVALTGNAANNCSGTPSGGSVAASPASGGGGTPITITASGFTVAAGITFQWQSSPDNSTWTNISGETNPTYSFTGISSNTYYRVNVTCSFSSTTTPSTSTLVTFLPTPSCTTTSSSWTGESGNVSYGVNTFSITGYSGSTLSDASMTSAANGTTGYLSRVSTISPINMLKGGTYSASATWGSVSSAQELQVWIDFDNNGTFAASEEVSPVSGYNSSSTPNPTNFTITIPSTAPVGIHLMRIRGIWETFASGIALSAHLDPCLIRYGGVSPDYYSGDCVDYLANIMTPPPSFTASPSSLTFPATTTSTYSGVQTFTVSGTYLLPATGTYTVAAPSNFEISPDNTTWYTTSYTVSYTSGTSTPTVYVRFRPTAVTSYSGNITVTGGGASSTLNVPVSGTGAAACSGTPTAGTASVSPSSGVATTAFTLSATGYTSAGSMTFQWQSSPDNSTWTNITGATNPSYSFTGISVNTYFRLNVTCTPSSSTATTGSVMASYFPSASCTPTTANSGSACTSYGLAMTGFSVTGESSTSITDAASCNGSGYLDRTSLICTLYKGSTYNTSVGVGTSYGDYTQTWIDFSNDGVFQTSESVGGSSSSIFGATTVPITIPSTAPLGTFRMRVVVDYSGDGISYPSMNPCLGSGYNYGEGRDYKVTISTPPPCTAPNAPTALSYNTTATSTTVSFTPPSPAPTGYILVRSSGALTGSPTAGQAVTVGTAVGSNGTIVGVGGSSATSVTASSLVANTNYTMTLFPYNNTSCTGGPVFNTSVSSTNITTCPNAPGTPTAGTPTGTTIPGVTWSTPAAGGGAYSTYTYLLNVYTDASLTTPATGYPVTGTTVTSPYTITGLSGGVTYYFTITAVSGACNSAPSGTGNASTPVVPCSGTPAAGAATSSPTSVIGSASFTLSVVGASGETGLTYQWQSSSCGSSWANVSGATGATLTTTESSATFYRRNTTCTTSSTSASSTSAYVPYISSSYCNITSTYGCTGDDEVNTFTLTGACGTSISDVNIGCPGTVVDHTSTVIKLAPGTTYTGTMNSVYASSETGYLWIDFNNNGTYDASEMVWSGSVPGSPSLATVTAVIPTIASGATYGVHRMRAMVIYSSTTSTGCPSVSYGNHVDYTVQIIPVPTITSNSPICAGGTLTLTATPNASCGATYTWSGPSSYNNVTVNTNTVTPTAVAGTYSLTVSVNGVNSCGTPGTTTVVVNPLPNVSSFSTPSATTACAGSPSTVTVNSSSLGVGTFTATYNLSGANTSTANTAVLTMGASSGTFTVPGSLLASSGATTVTITSLAALGCSSTVSSGNTTSITVNGKPNVSSFTSPTASTVCLGNASTITANSTSLGAGTFTVNYNLTGANTATGSTATLTMGASTGTFNTSTLASAGSTTVTITSITNSLGCITTLSASNTAAIPVNALPTVASITPAAATLCAGSPIVLTAGATTGTGSLVSYSWTGPNSFSTTTALGTNTSTVTPSTLASSGVYSVRVTYPGTGCISSYAVSSAVTVNATAAVYTVTGGGSYCSGGSGVAVGLSNSATGVTYQLYAGSTPVGTPVAGTGALVSFDLQTTVATYTVMATNTVTACTVPMSGSAAVAASSVPLVYNVTGGGIYCSGGAGVNINISNSQVGVSYQLYNGSSFVGSLMPGTGASLNLPGTIAGTYSVVANPGSACATTMTGSASVAVLGSPAAYNVTGGGGYCPGTGGTHVGLDWSGVGVNYQLYLASSPVGSVIPGSGAALDFGLIAGPGVYSVAATIVSTGCSAGMNGSTTVSVNPNPTAYAVTGGGGYCIGGTGVTIGLANSQTGINYQLYSGSSTVGAPVAGTGGSLDFGSQTAAGAYTILAINTATSCTSIMTGSATVSINSLPVAYTVTGGGAYCSGGSGVHVFLNGSSSGINYQLYTSAGTPVGSAMSGTGSTLDFGFVMGAGTYTVMATNATTTCNRIMTGNAVVTINTSPTAFAVSGGGSYCASGSGVAIGLSNSTSGITYQLYNGGSVTGSSVSGTGSAISFGPQTAAGTYTVLATNTGTSCTSAMTGSAVVNINATPNAFTMTGGGSYCQGGTGVSVGLGGSNSGVTYQLYNSSGAVGAGVAGTGSALSFGLQTAAGIYTVMATNTSTSCTGAMSGSSTIVMNAAPTAYAVSGGGNYCSGGSGVTVSLAGSNAGINYQLYNAGSPVGSPVTGTGAPLSFGSVTSAGTYTVLATNATTACTGNMSGSAAVAVNAAPTAYVLTGGGNYCAGGTGLTLALINSTTGINYQLYNGVTTVGTPVAGSTGSPISFGSQTSAGTYSVLAINASTGCTNAMSGTTSIAINPLPTAYTLTGGGSYCNGGSGLGVVLSGSNTGINYQLYNGASPVGSAVVGTGSPLNFGLQTTGGTYSVIATNTASTCTNVMSGIAPITVNILPTAYSVSGGGSLCSGGAGVHVFLSSSTSGVNYQVYNSGTAVGSPVAGTGASLDFGLLTSAGTYSIQASNATTGCVNSMTGTANVVVNPTPTAFSVMGGGSYCNGGSGLTIGLSSSAVGVNYQLYNGSSASGSPVAGTGSAISFGTVTAGGTYTVLATNATSSCTNSMTGSTSILVNGLPSVFAVTGGGSYCAGGNGVNVGMSGSTIGISYQLYNGVATIGSLVPGTGLPLDFGLKTAAGSYSVVAINPATTCTSNMLGSAAVVVNATPVTYSVTGGGSYCVGESGVNIGMSSSQTGINYQLYNGASLSGSSMSGTGASINFGLKTAAGTYSVLATNATTGCNSNMSGNAIVSINSLPNVHIVTGGGSYCSGGTGVNVGLNGTTIGASYQLYNGVTPVGSPYAGTGGSINFGLQTAPGSYNVVATNAATSCTAAMSGTASVTINTSPTVYAVTGGGNYCSGSGGANVGVSNSTSGISYQLYNGASATGIPVIGTGSAIDFGAQTAAGSYAVIASNMSSGCTSNMSGTATIGINPLPTAHNVTGGGSFCAGGTGVSLGCNLSTPGISYQLFNAGTPIGSPIAGTGSAISFGPQTLGGVYTVVATNTSTGCERTMNGSASVVVNPTPTAYTMTGGGSYCSGSAGTAIGLGSSNIGVSYQLYNGGSVAGSSVSGTGAAISFGLQTAAGSYTVLATNSSTGCTSTMSGVATVSVNALPAAFAISGGGNYCSGNTGVPVGLPGSEMGVDYTLFSGTTSMGTVAGTGAAISFGPQTAAGSYYAIATNATSSCVRNMTGTATINVNPLPVAYAMTGGGGYCAGGSGITVGLSGSNVGTTYQLYNGSTAVGSLAGSGGALSFGAQTAAGTYSVLATNTATTCTNAMSGNSVINVNPLPNAYAVLGMASSYCEGGSGVHVMLNSSDGGINYQLFNGSVATGPAVAGTGTTLDFGALVGGGVYMAVATDAISGCSRNMTGSAAITVNPLPLAYNVTGGGGYCNGAAGANVSLSGSNLGISYQLYKGGTAMGAPVAGTGSVVSFGPQPVVGSYMVVATNTASTCVQDMAGSVNVSINPLPAAFTVSGGGAYCAGGAGVAVGLSNSASGVNYQLYNGGVPVGSPVAGSGSAISFGNQTAAGTYTAVAINATTGCTNNMTGMTSVSINALPAAFAVTGGGSFCAGGTGVNVGLGGSVSGITYQLYNGSSSVGSPVTGTGSAISFGTQTMSGTYMVMATNASLCTGNMSGSAVVNINPLPTANTMTGGGSYCSGGTGVPVGLNNSNSGIRYQLYNGSTPVGAPMTGTGSALNFGMQTATGTYSVQAQNILTTCSNDMAGTSVVTINSSVTPSVSITTGTNDTVCLGSLITFIANPVNGGFTPTYQWQVNGVNVGLGGTAYTYVPSTGDVVTVLMTSTAICASPAAATGIKMMTVLTHQAPVANLSVTPGAAVCAGSLITFTPTPAYGGSAPTYTWYVNGAIVATTPGYAYIPSNGDVVYYALHSNYACLLSNDVNSSATTVSVDSVVVPVVSITAAPGFSITAGTTVTLTATVAGSTSATSYQWKQNGTVIPGATNLTYATGSLANGDTVTCVASNNGACGLFTGFNRVMFKVAPVGVVSVSTLTGDIRLIPNPNNGDFVINGTLEGVDDQDLNAEVTNMLGQVVYSNKLPMHKGVINERIHLGGSLANGMYMMNIRSASGNRVFHFVLEQQ